MAARIGRARPVSNYRPIHPAKLTQTIPGTMDVQLSQVTMDFTGTPTPPSGTVDMQLSPVTVDVAGQSDFGGSMSMTLSPVTEALSGSVNPIGGFDLTLSPVTIALIAETVPFGEHVIHVPAEQRAFRVVDEDPGYVVIYNYQASTA